MMNRLTLHLGLHWKTLLHYVWQLYQKTDRDRLTTVAGSLAYVSLLSLVPLVTVIFALLSIFPMFADMGEKLKIFIFKNFVPAAGDTIQHYLEQFASNSSQMTAVGIAGLFVTALLLIRAIDTAINDIWETQQRRSFVYSFAIYWMVLTLGPLLVGSSMAISSIVLSQKWLGYDLNSLFEPLLHILPFILSFTTFWLIYSVVPNQPVRSRNAAIGAFIAAMLFECGKKLFGLYVELFPTYRLIYGVLAVIPILFVWIYLSWCIVLLGAEITFSLQHRSRSPRSTATHRSIKKEIV